MTFEEGDLARIAEAEEIEIETRSATGAVHRATIWAVVDEGRVLIASVRGERGRWYREALADPDVAIWVDGHRLAGRATLVRDPATVAAYESALRRKYASDPGLGSMLRPEVLSTTLLVEPASSASL